MSSLIHTFEDVYTKVSEYIGYTDSPTASELIEAKDLVYRGYMYFLFPTNAKTGDCHVWSYLRREDVITLKANEHRLILPEDFYDFAGDLSYQEGVGYPPIKQRNMQWIKKRRASYETSSYPQYYALAGGQYSPKMKQRKEAWFYPTPTDDYSLDVSYVFIPEKPTSSTDYFIGGPLESEAILQSALAAAEWHVEEVEGIQNAKAKELIYKLIQSDHETAADSVGSWDDPSMLPYKDTSLGYFRNWKTINDMTEVYGYTS